MERILLIFSFLLAGTPVPAAEALDLTDPPPAWAEVLDCLEAVDSVRSRFEEIRSNPFHRVPRRFEGVIRWNPAYGLSIHYLEPREMVISITGEAIRLTREGETRTLGSAAEEPEVLSLLSRFFSWDRDWLAQHFSTSGDRGADGSWSLQLVPDSERFSGALTKIVIEGTDCLLRRIVMDLKAGRIVETRLADQEPDASFSKEELETAFPAHDG